MQPYPLPIHVDSLHVSKAYQINQDKDISTTGEMATSDIPALKEAAKEVMENISSEVNGKDGDANVMVNGGLQNGDGEDEQVMENVKSLVMMRSKTLKK